MNYYVVCAGTDGDMDDVNRFGPFQNMEDATRWEKQHANDPAEDIDYSLLRPGSEGWEDFIIERGTQDFDHWCENMYTSDGIHTIVHNIQEAKLDPPKDGDHFVRPDDVFQERGTNPATSIMLTEEQKMRYENFGPVANPDGTPTELTKQMLAGTGRDPEAFAQAAHREPFGPVTVISADGIGKAMLHEDDHLEMLYEDQQSGTEDWEG